MSDQQRNYELQPTPAEQRDPISLEYQPPVPNQSHAIGLIGCGGISETHLKAYQHAGLNVVAFADLSRARAENRRDEFYPNAFVYDDYEALMRSGDVTVVDIATPVRGRDAIIEAALRKGLHVLSQKPFVEDIDVGERLVKIADAQQCRLAVNQNGRWAPHLAYMRRAVQSGWIGQLASIEIGMHWDHNWIVGTPFDQMHHVILEDFAIHWFDFVASLQPGLPTSWTASETRASNQRATPPLVATVTMRYGTSQGGTQVSMHFDGDARYGAQDHTVVRGHLGTLRSMGPSLSQQRITVSLADGWFEPDLQGTWFTEGFIGTMTELLCSIEQGREPENNARDNLRSLQLAQRALNAVHCSS